jgi:hypothetical protein
VVIAFFNSRIEHIVGLAARHAIPAIFYSSNYAKAGGLMSYAARNEDAYSPSRVSTLAESSKVRGPAICRCSCQLGSSS